MRRLPFDLVPETTKLIPITQQEYSVLNGKSATANERKAIELIADKWCSGSGDSDFGIEIPIRSGWSGLEEEKFDTTRAIERHNAINGMELIKRIAEGKNISIEEATKLASLAQSGSIPDELIDFTDEIYSYFESLQSLTFDLLRETVLIKRAIPAWSEDLTAVLPKRIRFELSNIADTEDLAGVDEDPKLPPSTNSETTLIDSENTKNQTIDPSSSISTTGDLREPAIAK